MVMTSAGETTDWKRMVPVWLRSPSCEVSVHEANTIWLEVLLEEYAVFTMLLPLEVLMKPVPW